MPRNSGSKACVVFKRAHIPFYRMRRRVDDSVHEALLVAFEDIVNIRRVEVLEGIVLRVPPRLVGGVVIVPLRLSEHW